MTKTTLRAMPYAQAHIEFYPNCITLVSYTTPVAAIIGGVLVVRGLYSMTTRKHIGAFVREYCDCDYTVAKKCYEQKCGFDIATREFVALV